MKSQAVASVLGYVTIRVVGRDPEGLLNQAVSAGMSVSNIQPLDARELEMDILLKDFFRLRPLAKRTGCLVRIRKRHGFPFFLRKLERRKWFAAGIFVFLAGLYALSSLVWQVNITGNDRLAKEDILAAARKQGIYPYQWKFRMVDTSVIAKKLTNDLPGVTWIGIEIRGSQVNLRIVEAEQPEKKPLQSPRNLVSTADAVVTEIFAEKGRPLVKVNSHVRKGSILIKGIYGDEENQEAVVAEGKVRGLVWHEFNIVSPLTQKFKVYTGAVKERSYVVIGSKALQITGYGKLPFDKYETHTTIQKAAWRGYGIPAGFMKEKLMEVRYDVQKLDRPAARAIGLNSARAQILARTELEPKIVAEKILHDKTENGKVYMKVLMEVDQLISAEQSIIGQGE
ncbi:sporulation protein YqfD [Paenibacillus gansuensis]|uniref:Sporulation protein YqfD n=1 Tax=Paenibacillus gansuensis TaxID=306542 RepID=A0ABW5PFL0_9BACL